VNKRTLLRNLGGPVLGAAGGYLVAYWISCGSGG